MSATTDKSLVPETVAFAERRLRDGSMLKYKLTVLQQPERARACGQGAKSHADRRPVDPPPVVELKLFQGDDNTDVTFSFNSNFFLFATLESARPIANGRVQPPPALQPVLTGVPVSGMAYLDRPAPAGYFIFPDLSVRHEGKYRLHFALYEECKEEDDRIAMNGQDVTHFRVEVKSKPFTVFSAKKFPGLAESTSLSRIVAEQGCRVRIRRDVRMRRRSDKPGGGDDMYEDGGHYVRNQRRETPELGRPYPPPPSESMPPLEVPHRSSAATPNGQADKRTRSDSDVSTASRPEYNRMNPGYPERPSFSQTPAPPPPPSAPAMPAAGNYLNFGGQAVPQAPMVAPQNPPPSQGWSQGYQAHDVNYQPPQAPEHRRDSVDYNNNYYPQSQYPQRSQTPVSERSYPSSYTQSTPQYNHNNTYQPQPQTHTPAPQQKPLRQSREDLPPLKLTALEPRLPSLNSPSSATPNSGYIPPRSSTSQGALPSPTSYAPPSQSSSYHYPPSTEGAHGSAPPSQNGWGYSMIKPSEPAPRHAGQKRTWDRVFSSDQHSRERLTNGSRPTQNNYGLDVDEDDDDEIDFTKMRMSYRRADGVQITRALPDDIE
ncbi:velvet protein [Orbilia blumenaviensis]|uniref:Velvet protein n=1 Tax=Orbilia blumenaviensis TaxID=1796055 RepID=A0AAV9VJ50_9PEZI